jgi:predicted secreted protein
MSWATGLMVYLVIWWTVLFLHPKDFTGTLIELEQV